MTLRLFNTLTKTKEDFTPLDAKNVRMYVCGPTVYDFAHIGNARPVIVFDVLFRLLRHVYGDAHVTYVRNITDVDDKINARAAERGIYIRELTEETARIYDEDVAALGNLPPTVAPRATEHIAQMIAIIERLIASGHAYAADGHVLFDVPSMPAYGQLSRRSLEDMRAGARVDDELLIELLREFARQHARENFLRTSRRAGHQKTHGPRGVGLVVFGVGLRVRGACVCDANCRKSHNQKIV